MRSNFLKSSHYVYALLILSKQFKVPRVKENKKYINPNQEFKIMHGYLNAKQTHTQ